MDAAPQDSILQPAEAAAPARPTRKSAVADRIIRQLDANIDGHRASGDAFVVSVYGEWGIGKSYCLEAIRDSYTERLDSAIKGLSTHLPTDRLIVPVFFDPWRYEHEEHLVVPLLKTIEVALRRLQRDLAAEHERAKSAAKAFSENVDAAKHQAIRAVKIFFALAKALAVSVKIKTPLIEIAPKDFFESVEKSDKAIDEDEAKKDIGATPAPLTERESFYFETQQKFEEITKHGSPSLRLVVLIDDLDRCLPEKAVQMLESVKLFLNVPGFSFVMAVDDEVVERGIAHRYKDYLSGKEGERAGEAPITGAEYLEKIVHLPVHLQRWTEAEARDHLREYYPQLFAPVAKEAPASADAEASKPRQATGQPAGTAELQKAEAVLSLLVRAVPLVPRKLVRLAEGIGFMVDHIRGVGEAAALNLEHVARIVALQQLYPTMYRFLRMHDARYWRLFEVSLDEFEDPVFKNVPLTKLNQVLESRDAAERAKLSPEPTVALREQQQSLQYVERACKQRGAPNPLKLFCAADGKPPAEPPTPGTIEQGMTYKEFHELYLHGLARKRSAAKPAPQSHLELPVSAIGDPGQFLAMLLSNDTAGRGSYLEDSDAIGGRLPDDVFSDLQDRLSDNQYADLKSSIEWVRDIARVTSPAQLASLYTKQGIIDEIIKRHANPASTRSK